MKKCIKGKIENKKYALHLTGIFTNHKYRMAYLKKLIKLVKI